MGLSKQQATSVREQRVHVRYLRKEANANGMHFFSNF